MIEKIQQITQFIQSNPAVVTIVGLGGAGIFFMWIKAIPSRIWGLIKKQFTTELTINSFHLVFYDILRLIETQYRHKNLRKLKATNGKWGADTTIISMGYGTHFIRYKKHFLWVTMTKESANQSEYDKDTLSFVKIGRSRKIFEELIAEAIKPKGKDDCIKMYQMASYWEYVKNLRTRSLNSVFIESHKINSILTALNKFINNEQWYLSHGIPYQMGILLYGCPGTGKTSLIKAIACYLQYNIHYLSPGSIENIQKAFSTLPEKTLLVIEDIDSNYITNTREDDKPVDVPCNPGETEDKKTPSKVIPRINTSTENFMDAFKNEGLSEILNSLDGLFSVHGRILFATTNHIEKLDKALIRPGRIDLKIEVGYANKETLLLFLNSFYPDEHQEIKVLLKDINIKSNLTIATLQSLVLEGYSLSHLLDYIKI